LKERDRRRAEAEAHEAKIAAARKVLADEVTTYLAVIADAEAAARKLAESITKAMESTIAWLGLPAISARMARLRARPIRSN
jgi:hypothetical protein